jgi:hypothetical protein
MSASLPALFGSTQARRPTPITVASPAGAAAGGVTAPGQVSSIEPARQRFAHTDQVDHVSHERFAQVHAHSWFANRWPSAAAGPSTRIDRSWTGFLSR